MSIVSDAAIVHPKTKKENRKKNTKKITKVVNRQILISHCFHLK